MSDGFLQSKNGGEARGALGAECVGDNGLESLIADCDFVDTIAVFAADDVLV
ncbi:MAG: hypothetical protein ACRYGK_03055 [Janthinobacterium lividum]